MTAQPAHWSRQQEAAGSDRPIWFLLWLVRVLPYPLLACIAFPVGLFYAAFSPRARQEALRYQRVLREFSHGAAPRRLSACRQILSFAHCLLEKVAGWSGKATLGNVIFHDDDVAALKRQLAEGRGAVLIGSHLGNIELLRCLASYDQTGVSREVPVTAIMDLNVTSHFSRVLAEFNPRYRLDMIGAEQIDIGTIGRLQERVAGGGLVVIAGDRTSAASPQRSFRRAFLGRDALFPCGTFFLASLLDAPVYFVFSLRQAHTAFAPRYNMLVTKSAISFDCPRKERQARTERLCGEFVRLLEARCMEAPYQWYNFYDFWAQPAPGKTEDTHE